MGINPCIVNGVRDYGRPVGGATWLNVGELSGYLSKVYSWETMKCTGEAEMEGGV